MMNAEYTDQHCKNVLKGFVLPGLPHPLLKPEGRPAWQKVRDAYDQVAAEVKRLKCRSPDEKKLSSELARCRQYTLTLERTIRSVTGNEGLIELF